MPEMPEVETIRRVLAKRVVGQTIQAVDIRLPRLIKWPNSAEFAGLVTGRIITALERRGKYLIFRLDAALLLVVHLRMTGRLLYHTPDMEYDKYTHIVFRFLNEDALLYADTRTLGTLYVLPPAQLWRINGLATLGPEPLSQEFTGAYFVNLLATHRGKIKGLLLNQKYIGGLGNIYVDESLVLAGIHPERVACSLAEDEMLRLYKAINEVIADGIEHGGTTVRDYRDSEGKSGTHQHHLRVYGRKNQPCLLCGTLISKTEVAGRGTHYCPYCQKK